LAPKGERLARWKKISPCDAPASCSRTVAQISSGIVMVKRLSFIAWPSLLRNEPHEGGSSSVGGLDVCCPSVSRHSPQGCGPCVLPATPGASKAKAASGRTGLAIRNASLRPALADSVRTAQTAHGASALASHFPPQGRGSAVCLSDLSPFGTPPLRPALDPCVGSNCDLARCRLRLWIARSFGEGRGFSRD
jgi:hypothetical protein